ncbi:Benzoate--CoA ligase, peroxisomal [Platanthera zijinensis]|uniref:4-coumarate--CoA ligase n=1 Tax=Platanthera zijinensis TaxID=2320716 RepID=A0AAP0BW76_9ASPA
MDHLAKNPANYVALSPVTFLHRAAAVYADRTSLVYNRTSFTWRETYERCRRLASALRSRLRVSKNDVVSVLAPNVPAMYEAHFGVPMAGAVLNTINTRLDARTVASLLRHSEAKVFLFDSQFASLAHDALRHLLREDQTGGGVIIPTTTNIPIPVVIEDPHAGAVPRASHSQQPPQLGGLPLEYEELIAAGDPSAELPALADEWDPIALNYTSGTTSAPKGVVYSHRSAYLSTLSLLLQWGVGMEPVYLWSLPMFHCNGWTFTWGMAARGGTNVCIRHTLAPDIYRAIADHRVTHMCCAPIVFNLLLLLGAESSRRRGDLGPPVEVLTGGAPPPAALLEKVQKLGFRVTHAYGMTEATGPALICEWRSAWDSLPGDQQARLRARQGISVLSLADVDVKDAGTMSSVARDGKAVGEIVLRGSSLMKGYLKNDTGTKEAFRDGWFLTGDVGVVHPDGYVEIKDRSKDVIISGGENISSVEVEAVFYGHPNVSEAAVVAMPHPHWGETPCAFLALKTSDHVAAALEEEEILAHCRRNMPHFMVPKKVVFMPELPKTSTGKIQKNKLREMARELSIDFHSNS